MIAVVPVRDGVPAAGAGEVVAETGGDALLVGSGTARAHAAISAHLTHLRLAEAGSFRPGAWAAALAPLLAAVDVVLLPASPDGRDLAPRLAAELSRPLWAGAVAVSPGLVQVARYGGRVLDEVAVDEPFVATLVPGVVGNVQPAAGHDVEPEKILIEMPGTGDARSLEVLPADPATVDLAEAPAIFAGGAGLGSAAAFALLQDVANTAGASVGATRVACDLGWAGFDRQIGTTGVSVSPNLYVAMGISGGVQHLAGIGSPEHVISVNTDPSCPMMARANLAVVADAPAVLRALASRLLVGTSVE